MRECEKLKTRKVIMKTAAQVAKQPPIGEKTSIFVAGMSKLMSQLHEESIENASVPSTTLLKSDLSNSLVKG
jgi:hypothetical protein